ncbi:hypothetical protein CYY_000440 [Polysphondylium violaceum]|uniref:Uncharacterized protein n=1 Tax=Polysphondylium violaceum TaxID=133409 RepID=A0A8J4Q3U2_9MYCE|nr:hypothetical protein CYY_000440 [Polysphondylium violaceum]
MIHNNNNSKNNSSELNNDFIQLINAIKRLEEQQSNLNVQTKELKEFIPLARTKLKEISNRNDELEANLSRIEKENLQCKRDIDKLNLEINEELCTAKDYHQDDQCSIVLLNKNKK